MKKVKVVSVRLKNLTEISEKCYKAEDWQGNSGFIPKSQVFGKDHEVQKSDAYWISHWFAIKEDFTLMISLKKIGWYNINSGKIEPNYDITIEHHIPEKINPVENNTIPKLKK
ncbi:hypothetical protein [Chryseobacterium aquaticum]|uniref:Uncharacterized protein n=1 Tax=Chryseobacterium aquaticum subsp. greenlandense TaxID=345663 RepID=A0A101CHS6_9FLAO|nr:hypothetical protein [Chryseobacterium aquaticum]KUJ56464.1 hypothetical protein AR686_07835 [Chryseobacterium aquaticum subsp. greenlandense]